MPSVPPVRKDRHAPVHDVRHRRPRAGGTVLTSVAHPDDGDGPRRRPFDDLVALIARIFVRHGFAPRVAAVLARNCATAQRDGSVSHGVFRVPNYVDTVRSGYADGAAQPRLEDVAPSFLRADAGNGFAPVALAAAAPALEDKAARNGIAVLAIRNSHHLGALYLDLEPFADRGFIALSVVNSIGVVAPPGGHAPVYGTNPLAMAVPRAGKPPLVFDMATSAMAHGDIQVARRTGGTLPPGTGIDAAGAPTTDPAAVLDGGALLPFGGHKGAAISLMVELLCAGLVGADFSFEVDSTAHPGAKSARTGQTVILIDPRAGAGTLRPFAARVDVLAAALLAAGQDRIPGDARLARRAIHAAGTVDVSDEDWATLATLDAATG